MKITSALDSHSGTRLLGIGVVVSLALGIALALLLVPGSVGAGGPDGFTAPIVLKEGRTPPEVTEPPRAPAPRQVRTVVEPPSVRKPPQEQTVVEPPNVLRDVTTRDVSAQQQTEVELVGNNDKADAGDLKLDRDRGQPFTTGSNAAGYKLTKVQIAANDTLASVGNYSVSIASDGGSGPGSTLSGGGLNEPAGLVTGVNDYNAPGDGIDLDANTTYYIFIDMAAAHTADWKSTTDDGENSNPAAGWSVGNASYLRAVGSTGSWTKLGTHKLKIKVFGYATPPPAVTSAEINGASLSLTFDKDLDTSSVPAAGQFTILVDGSSHAATGISISGKQVRLTVLAVTAVQTVTVSYSKPTSNPLKGTNGGDVAAFSNQAVANNSPPGLSSAAINGSTLDLYFNRNLNTGSGTAANRFTIEVGGSSHAATGISISGKQVRLTVPDVVKGGQFVTVSYSKPGSKPLKGSNGTDVDSFSNRAVDNNTPASTGSGTVRAPITIQEGGETLEVKAYSADRDTLVEYFTVACRQQKNIPTSSLDGRDYSWYNADGHRMMARNGWKWVEVQNANGDVTHTRPMTISECASLKLYQRQQFCENYTTGQLAPSNKDNVCPADRTW